ncbi:MAG: endonuclease III [Aquificota bacterium]|nr:MAG: endonuclease III [Aquificota bacterium]
MKKKNKEPCFEKVNFTEKEVITKLKKHFPEAKTELNFKNPFELLIVVLLSAQTTDVKVNEVSPKLFEKYPDPEKLSKADIEDLYEILKPINYYRKKAKFIKEAAQIIAEKYNGKIPDTIDELVKLPGIGRKTASVILVNGFKKPAIVVDTHVKRVSKRLGLTCYNDPLKVEQDLSKFFSKENWVYISNALVLFGRYICTARKPKCKECNLLDICPYDQKNI